MNVYIHMFSYLSSLLVQIMILLKHTCDYCVIVVLSVYCLLLSSIMFWSHPVLLLTVSNAPSTITLSIMLTSKSLLSSLLVQFMILFNHTQMCCCSFVRLLFIVIV